MDLGLFQVYFIIIQHFICPFIEYYLFHIGPFFILVYFNMIMIDKLINHGKNINTIVYYYSLLSLVFINIVFYRIGEHGTDRSSQILLILIFLLFIEIFYLKKIINYYLAIFH